MIMVRAVDEDDDEKSFVPCKIYEHERGVV